MFVVKALFNTDCFSYIPYIFLPKWEPSVQCAWILEQSVNTSDMCELLRYYIPNNVLSGDLVVRLDFVEYTTGISEASDLIC